MKNAIIKEFLAHQEIIELKNSELVKNIDNANNLISIGNLILEEKDE